MATEVYEVLTLRLRPGEWDLLMQTLREEGLPETPEGAHKLFFDWLKSDGDDGDDEEKPVTGLEKTLEYLKEHPEVLGNLGAIGKAAMQRMMKKKAGL